jgi:hypothetical protein
MAPAGLEPGSPEPETLGEGVQLLLGVGEEMGPAIVDPTDGRRLPPVVDVDRHRSTLWGTPGRRVRPAERAAGRAGVGTSGVAGVPAG